MKIIGYQIVQSGSPQYLADQVARLCADGWMPQGGIAVVRYNVTEHCDLTEYYQAMVVKIAPEPPPT